MTTTSVERRSALGLLARGACALAFAGLLSACGNDALSFRNVDVTGADYAKDFSLTDHTGKARTLADFRGKVVVMFFGYTQCPDVCPTTMAEMRAVVDALGPDGARVQVLFVTVDPERDTQSLLAQYVPSFHPSFIGLYGDAAATTRTAQQFKVFFQKVPGSAAGTYTVDHTAGSYVYDPQGRLRLFVRHGQAASLVEDIRTLLRTAG